MALEDKNYIPIVPPEDIETAAKYGLLGAAGVYGVVHGTKYVGVPQLIAPVASRTSTIIDKKDKKVLKSKKTLIQRILPERVGFYGKGANKPYELLMHLIKNPTEEIDKFIEKFPGEFPEGMSKSDKHRYVKRLIDREYGIRTPAELVHQAEAMKIEQRWAANEIEQPYGRGKALKKLRHEKLKNEMVNLTMGKKFDPDAIYRNGLSRPVFTDVKNIFRGREYLGATWELHGDVKASVSHIRSGVGGDLGGIMGDIRKDHMYKMAERVVKSGVPLGNKARVRAVASDIINQMGTDLRGTKRLHHTVKSHAEALEKFMGSYKIGPNGELIVNFSPGYKSHYLSGGVNADVKLWKGPRGGFKYDIFVSDRYDVVGSPVVQKNVHFNIAHSTNEGKRIRAADLARTGRRTRLKKSLSVKDYKKAARHSKKLIKKLAFKIGRKAIFKI